MTEFTDHLKRSLGLKERCAQLHFERFALECCKEKRVGQRNPVMVTGYMAQPLVSCFQEDSRCEQGDHMYRQGLIHITVKH